MQALIENFGQLNPVEQRELLFHAKVRLEKLRCLDDPAYFIEALGYDVAAHHKTMLDFIQRDAPDIPKRSLILAPRGAGKSTIFSVGYVMWLLLKNPEMRILIVSATQTQAVSFLREIRQRVEGSKALHTMFGNLVGKKWTESEADLATRTDFSKEANITALGVGGPIVSKHYDLLMIDDIVDEDSARTQKQREKLLQWFNMSLLPTLEPGGSIIICGTRYHMHDIYGTFLRAGYKDNNCLIKAIEDDKSYWPEYFSIEHLKEKRVEISSAIFNAQYQNDPTAMTGGMFKLSWFKNKWRWVSDNTIIVNELDPVTITDTTFEIYQGMDLAISMKTSADYTAHQTTGLDKKTGNVYALETIRGRFTPTEQLNLVKSQYNKWAEKASRPVSVGIESIAYQDALPHAVVTQYPHIPVVRIKPYKDKVTRAYTVVAIAEDGRLFLPENDTSGLEEELIDFPQGDHDDLVDALEMSIQGSRRGTRTSSKPRGM